MPEMPFVPASLNPTDEDQRRNWAELQACEALEKASDLIRVLQGRYIDGEAPELEQRIWATLGAWYEAGRLRPRPIDEDQREVLRGSVKVVRPSGAR